MIGHVADVHGRRFNRLATVLSVLGLAALSFIAEPLGMQGWSIVALALVLWATLAVVTDAERVSHGRLPLGVPALVLALPFFHLLLPWGGWEYVFQGGVVALTVFYLALVSRSERRAVLRRALPMLVPVALLVAALTMSYALSDGLTKHDLYGLFSLVAAVAFVPMAAFYCRSLGDLRRLAYILIVAGLLQLPVVLGQAAGLADNLPGGLAQLSPAQYGGSLAGRLGTTATQSAIVTRYQGTFGDYENLAEYCGIVLLLCVGLLLFDRGRRRWVLLAGGTAGAAVVGWFTGTRGFAIGTAGGVAILLLAALLLTGPRLPRLWRLAATVLLGVTAIIVFIPGQVTEGFVSRLTNSDMSLSSPNAFDRLSLFRVWLKLAGRMPVSGYGPRMREVLQLAAPYNVGWPHSLYFWGLLTAGVFGLLAVILLVAIAIFLPARSAFRRGPTEYRELACVFTVVAVYLAVSEAKIEFVRHSFYVDIIFLLLGMLSSLFVLSRDAAAAQAQSPPVSPVE
jgi:hypothetical protein